MDLSGVLALLQANRDEAKQLVAFAQQIQKTLAVAGAAPGGGMGLRNGTVETKSESPRVTTPSAAPAITEAPAPTAAVHGHEDGGDGGARGAGVAGGAGGGGVGTGLSSAAPTTLATGWRTHMDAAELMAEARDFRAALEFLVARHGALQVEAVAALAEASVVDSLRRRVEVAEGEVARLQAENAALRAGTGEMLSKVGEAVAKDAADMAMLAQTVKMLQVENAALKAALLPTGGP